MKSIRTFAIALTVVLVAVATSSAALTEGAAGDGKTSLSYDSATGAFGIQPDGQAVGLYQILSASGIFNSTVAAKPPGGLGLDVDSAGEKSWAALSASAFTTNFSLGNIAAPGLTRAFLLGDLSATLSGGFGTANRETDLVYIGGVMAPPVVVDAPALTRIQGAQIAYQFTTSAGDAPITWGNLAPVAGNPAPVNVPTLSAGGAFAWNSQASPFGSYSWDVTATNAGGTDTGRISVTLIIPEPATISLVGLMALGFVGLFRRSR